MAGRKWVLVASEEETGSLGRAGRGWGPIRARGGFKRRGSFRTVSMGSGATRLCAYSFVRIGKALNLSEPHFL